MVEPRLAARELLKVDLARINNIVQASPPTEGDLLAKKILWTLKTIEPYL